MPSLEIKSPKLRRLYDDWDRRRRGRAFPSRSDFDPIDLKYVLGNLSLVDVLRDPLRFRYRVHASIMANRIGADMTGKYLEEMTDLLYYERAKTTYTEVVEKRAPTAGIYRSFITDDQIWHYDVLVLPLAADGTTIDMLMSCSILQD